MTVQLRQLAARIIARARQVPADAALKSELRNARLSPEESGAVANAVFNYFRWQRWLNPADSIDAQLYRSHDLERRFDREPDSFSTEELQQAIPAWAQEEIEVSRAWLASLQSRPALWLRAKHQTRARLAAALGDCINAPEPATDGLEYRGDRDLFRTPQFHQGEFEVQDLSSQFVGILCNALPGETWWDACAGEGGKTLHLSELMQNKGLIWASDRSERRLAVLKRRAARARAFNYRTVLWEGGERRPTKTKFDGVLIDAPCSGAGTWQRNPHARWTIQEHDVRELGEIQRSLIMNAAPAVKPGGKLIYAVCTLTKTETSAVADLCSQQLIGFEPLSLPAWPNEPQGASDRRWFWPQTYRGNGMFVAAWQRVK